MEKIAQYSTILFKEVYPDVEDFTDDYALAGFPLIVSDASIRTLYYLLYARYANNPIGNRDVNQWKMKLFGTIFQYGPTWEKRLDIQAKLRNLTDKELKLSGKAIRNRAYNPDTTPGTASVEELLHINDQDTTTSMRAPLDAYAILWELLDNDVTEGLLLKFQPLFKTFVSPERVLLYYNPNDLTEEELEALEDLY